MIPYGRQDISGEDIEAVSDVLRSDFLTQGPLVPRFEELISKRVNARFGVATNSATSALHVACLSLGLSKGQRVWTSPISFVASANCALYCGAEIDFVDIEPDTFNLCPEALEEKLTWANKKNLLPDVVIPVHMAGQSCEMKKIKQLSERFGFKIIEDASHAVGASYFNDSVGSCSYSDITVFSFHPVKIITSGEGGMALTNDEVIAEKMKQFRSHGITRNSDEFLNKNNYGWYYEQQYLGFNYRMTDIHAALGISQFNRLDEFVKHRNVLAKRYKDFLSKLPVCLPKIIKGHYSSWHLYIIQVSNRNELFTRLRDAGIGVNVHYIPIHLQPFYSQLGFRPGLFPRAEAYYNKAISIPIFGTMSFQEQDECIKKLGDLIYEVENEFR